jgi:hypothetical protein
VEFVDFQNAVVRDGLSGVTNRFYSMYLATVSSNQDPMGLGRIQIVCPTVGHLVAPQVWVLPAMMGAGNKRGMFYVPEEGDTVFVNFYEGDPTVPQMYFGGWYGMVDGSTADTPTFLAPPASLYPEKKGIVTRAGHALIFNDTVGSESVVLLWNQPAPGDPELTNRTSTAAYNKGIPSPTPAFPGQKLGSAILSMDATGILLKSASSFIFQIDESKGALSIATPNGSMISFTPTGNIQLIHNSGSSIAMSPTGITVSAAVAAGQVVNITGQSISVNGGAINIGSKASDFAVLGLKLIAWLAAHTHPYSFGTTLPPVPPPTPADFCSQTIKVQM